MVAVRAGYEESGSREHAATHDLLLQERQDLLRPETFRGVDEVLGPVIETDAADKRNTDLRRQLVEAVAERFPLAGNVLVWPWMTIPSESPTRTKSTPASSERAAMLAS